MESLNNIINSILQNPEKWSYYPNDNEHNNNLSNEIREPEDINNPEKCYRFIEQYIRISGKEYNFVSDALRFFKKEETNGEVSYDKRLCHIVSLFFLGLALYNHKSGYFSKEIRNELRSLDVFDENDDIDQQFIFVWFLVYMFHDLGYVYENQLKETTIDGALLKEAKRLRNKFPWFIKKYIKENLIIRLKYGKETIPTHYEAIVKNYLKYRGNRDHGILGGICFATEVAKLREQKYKYARDDEQKRWKPELDKLYYYVGWRICCHNIWYKRICESSIQEFIDYANAGLSPLILGNEKEKNGIYKEYPISSVNHPLFFFFCLVDTIEPTKICGGIPHNMTFDITNDNNNNYVLKISCPDNSDYIEKISKSLNSWLAGTRKEGNTVSIYLE